ncbi:Coiled-coil domain-containing protein 170 [Geodia barretti]|uniref:Coiled-coil domain-containing protein 170 n=1 Tax=Geodia barretti TaxID=519541 RepID=A0AA35XB51_GEOBA|nr:Coiled-coil domain-containing protein 170 [Geodia barretti]
MSAGAEPTTLPGISTIKTSLVEVAMSNTPRSPPPCGGDELLGGSVGADAWSKASGTPPALLPGRRMSPQQAGGASQRAATSPLYLPRPPSTPPRESTTGKLRRSLEYIRLSRSELDEKEQTIGSLRSENVKLQAAVRELKNLQQSYSALQSACSDLAQCLGCSVEGVAAESVGDILHNQATSLLQDRQHTQQQLKRLQDELERSRGDTAAASVQVSSLEAQVQQARSALLSRDSELQRLQAKVERLQGSEARNNTALQSLRQRLTEMEGARGGEDSQQRLSELHTEIGRLRKALHEKEASEQRTQSELEACQAEVEETRHRVANLEEMYEDLCLQLAIGLQLGESATHDVDTLLAEVGRLAQESPQLRLRTETLTKTLKTCELDSRANRETILRLVSEVKKHEKLAAQVSDLQEAKMEQEALLESLERERNSYQERLVAAKETMAAQEEELQAKEIRVRELASNWHSLKATADAESELIAAEQQKYRELCKAVGSLVGSSSTEAVELLQTLEQVVQGGHQLRQRLEVRDAEQVESGRAHGSLRMQLAEVEAELERQRGRVKQLEGELLTQTLAKEGLERDMEKEQQFHQRLSKALKFDSTTAQVVTGDFARDAILVRAEQMTKHETQTLAEKQSALYSVQRQLKTCRQTLGSKEMYLGLLQKKASSLEGKLQEMSQREAHLENMAGKVSCII